MKTWPTDLDFTHDRFSASLYTRVYRFPQWLCVFHPLGLIVAHDMPLLHIITYRYHTEIGNTFPKKKGKKIGQKYYNVIIIYLRTYTKWKTLYILLYRLIKRFRVVRAYYICVRYGLAVSMVSGCYYDFYTDFYYCNSSFFCEPQEVKFLKRNHQAGLWW